MSLAMHNLKAPTGTAKKKRRRVGRGDSSGSGTYFDSVTARPSFGSRSSQEKSTLLRNFKKSCSWYRIQSAIWISRASARPSPAMPVRVATTPSHSSSPCIVKIETAMCRNANSCGQRRVIREDHSPRRYSMRSVMTGPSASTPGSRDV